MRRLNLLLAIRQLQKHRSFTLLNILGLTLGLTTFFLIILYVADELSYDRFNVKADRICRINTDLKYEGKITYFADAAPPVAPTLLHNYPEVEQAVRLLPVQGGMRIRKGEAEIQESRVVVCDPGIFEVFTMPMIEGNPATALQAPNTVVITESTALKYFKRTNVLGQTLRDIDDTAALTITGVIRDLPAQSCFHYDLFISMSGNGMATDPNFYSFFPMSTFVLLKPGANRALFDKKLAGLMRNFVREYAAIEKDNAGEYYIALSETPLTDIHLHSNRTDELSVNGNIQYVYIFSVIAVFVLLIAAINFMNLSTARSANRAREVGVRKVLGSTRVTLMAQFLLETGFMTLAAAVMAIALTYLLLPGFNALTNEHLAFGWTTLINMLPYVALTIGTVGLFAGAWPAFFLSAFKPVQVLKGTLALGGRGSGFRSILVVIQFTVSMFLIVGTLIIYRQLHYIRSRDLGFNRARVLIVKGMNALADPVTLRNEVTKLPGVTDATLSGFLPTNDKRWHNSGTASSTDKGGWCQMWKVDAHYLPTLGMQLVQGRNFSSDYGRDSTALIINETAARLFSIADDPLNKNVSFAWYHGPRTFHTIGVVKDFNYASLRNNIEPLAFANYLDDDVTCLAVRANSDDVPDLLARLKDQWTALMPHRTFEYSFMDADFDALYHAEQRMGTLSILFSALAIGIACLGLFGLAAYAAERRSKEIGIRKVLGASVTRILALLSFDFLRLIAISILITIPVTWLALNSWLENFAYRTDIGPWVFAIGAALVVLIALATTLYQSLKAAVTNPVDTLRNE
jgi:putative ABC transport system permease protein